MILSTVDMIPDPTRRIVTPTRHPHHFVPEEDDNQLDFVSNKALTLMMRQMSGLVRQAEEIFGDLERECRTVDRRCKALVTRIDNIQTNINNLDDLEERIGG